MWFFRGTWGRYFCGGAFWQYFLGGGHSDWGWGFRIFCDIFVSFGLGGGRFMVAIGIGRG
ncbi:hypothetical protein [Helicobacter macacae]|uniref:hypothetical protein n=1 Tax=Helicobacter macacae TaxID=398626 RepID=UPI0011DDEF69|nr:hypothetical protein [Helicobacter macacae]